MIGKMRTIVLKLLKPELAAVLDAERHKDSGRWAMVFARVVLARRPSRGFVLHKCSIASTLDPGALVWVTSGPRQPAGVYALENDPHGGTTLGPYPPKFGEVGARRRRG